MIGITGKMDERFKARFTARFEQYQFTAGIMPEDQGKPHFPAKSILTKSGKRKKKKAAFTTVGGMKARRKAGKLFGPAVDDISIKQIYEFACKRVGFDIVKRPFQSPNSGPMSKLRKELSKFFQAQRPMANRKRVEDAMRNVIQEPIRRRRYGSNAPATVKVKGFNRLLFDTGQLWLAMKAKVTRVPKATKNV